MIRPITIAFIAILSSGCAPDLSLFGLVSDEQMRPIVCGHCDAALRLTVGETADGPGVFCKDAAYVWDKVLLCACGLPDGPAPECADCAAWCDEQRAEVHIWNAAPPSCIACLYAGTGCHDLVQLCAQDITP